LIEISTLLEIFTGIVAVALLLQCAAFWGIHRSIRNISARMDTVGPDLLKEIKPLSANIQEMLSTIKAIADKTQRLQESLAVTAGTVQKRVADLDAFLSETTDAARLQVVRIQDVVDTATRRIEETFDLLHTGIMAPVSEIGAIAKGIRVGLDVLLRRRRTPASTHSQDDEMFI